MADLLFVERTADARLELADAEWLQADTAPSRASLTWRDWLGALAGGTFLAGLLVVWIVG